MNFRSWYITLTSLWARLRLKSPASRLFTQAFIQAQIKENIKAPRHWPLCGEFRGDRWIPRTNGQLRGKCFHLMTLSWIVIRARENWCISLTRYITILFPIVTSYYNRYLTYVRKHNFSNADGRSSMIWIMAWKRQTFLNWTNIRWRISKRHD